MRISDPVARGGLRRGLLMLVFCLLLLAPAAGMAEEQATWGYALAHELMSPFCPGRTLASCPSPQADEVRAWILKRESEGATQEQVEAELYERFGEVIRSSPRARGWGLAAWLLPIVSLLAGAALVFLILRRIVKPASAEASAASSQLPGAGLDPELERLVDEEFESRSG